MESASASPIMEQNHKLTTPSPKDFESELSGGSQLDLNWEDALHPLSAFSLAWASLGDYIIIMNEEVDVICGEPYAAIQLWFDKKSRKFLGRVWNQTVATGRIENAAQLIEICTTHLKRRPCIGYPAHDLEQKGQDFLICPTPLLRKISQGCQKILNSNTSASIKSCPECLKYTPDTTDSETTLVQPTGNVGITTKVESLLDHSESPLQPEGLAGGEQDFNLAENVNIKHVSIVLGNPEDSYEKGAEHKDERCGEKLKGRSSWKAHMKSVHDGKRFHCNLCSFKTDHRTLLKRHISGVHEKKRDYTCEICGLNFSQKASATRHVKSMHKIFGNSQEYIKVPNESRSRKRSNSHRGHRALHIECNICGKTMYCTLLRPHMRTQHGMQGTITKKCEWCEKVVACSSLSWHAKKVHFLGNFSCPKCYEFKADFAGELIRHITEEHGKEEQFARCPCCAKTYPLQQIEAHYRECISKKFKEEIEKRGKCDKICETCGKTLNTRKKYYEHMKRHSQQQALNGEEQLQSTNLFFYCDQCGKRFLTTSGLREHNERFHESGNYACSSCQMTFNTISQRRDHNNIEHSTDEKFKCRYCNLRYGSLALRKRHELAHKEPKFECKHCNKKLKNRANLTAHERHHTGEKPFECPECSSHFVSLQALQQHTKGVHKIIGPKGGKTGWKNKSEVKQEAMPN